MLDAVGFEDAAHLLEANLVSGGVDVRVNQADAVPTGLRRCFDSVLEAEGADFGRTERIDIAGEREVGGNEFDFRLGGLKSEVQHLFRIRCCNARQNYFIPAPST